MNQASHSQEFKERLYQNFKDIGVLDKLKLTLRKTLLDKLQIGPPQQDKIKLEFQRQQSKLPFVLRKKFMDRIVCEYLQRCNYEYTLSIFLPEAHIDKDDMLTLNEMCRVVDIEDHQLSQLKKLKAEYSFLDALLHVYQEHIHRESYERGTQTTMDEPLSKKLEDIDKHFVEKIDYWKLGGATNFEQKLKKLNKDTEDRLRYQFDSEKSALINTVQARIRREQSDKFSRMGLLNKREQEAAYEKKLTDLKRRERQVLESLELKRKQCEEEVSKLRDKEHDMIKRYEWKDLQLQKYYDEKTRQLKEKEKHLQSLQLQAKVRKKQYEDCIRMVKNKIVEEATKSIS